MGFFLGLVQGLFQTLVESSFKKHPWISMGVLLLVLGYAWAQATGG